MTSGFRWRRSRRSTVDAEQGFKRRQQLESTIFRMIFVTDRERLVERTLVFSHRSCARKTSLSR